MPALHIPVGRSLAILTLLLIASLPVARAGAVRRARSAPRVVVPFTSFDFGDVYTGEIVSQIFVIRNEGDAELQIKEFKGDCGCTVTRYDRVIPPGKEATAELEVQTISQSGLINKTATLHTNDPDKPAVVFTLIANVLAGSPLRQGKHIGPIFLSPGPQAAMYASAGRKATAELSVAADRAPVKLLRVEAATEDFAARLEVIEPGRSYKILIESSPMGASGLYKGRLRVLTDNPTLPAFAVDLALRVYANQ